MIDVADAAPRNQRLRPEAFADLMGFKRSLVRRYKLGVISGDNVNRAFAEAVAQLVSNPAAQILDDREWTPVRCRGCGYTTSVLRNVSSWACRCFPALKREAFVDAIGPDGLYLLDAHAMVNCPNASDYHHDAGEPDPAGVAAL
jgi:hypothetical protein